MRWKNEYRAWLATLALGAALIGCRDSTDRASQSPSITGPSISEDDDADDATVYDQVDFLGNPLVSEVTIMKVNHARYNLTQPYNTAEFLPQTAAFVTNVAGRPAALAATLGSVLYPDMLVVDASKATATAGWLSWALANGWGGRKLTDDVVDIGLTAIFSTLLSPTGASCAPFTLPLCTDNVGSHSTFQTAFPYLANPK